MIEWIVSSSVLILIVLTVRTLGKNRLSCRARYALWLLVLVRLLVPAQLFTASWGVAEVDVPEVVVTHRDDAGLQLAPVEPNPLLPREEQEAQARQNWAEYEAEMRQGRIEHGTPVTLAEILHVVWLAGAGVMAIVLLVSNLRFARRLRRTRVPYDALVGGLGVYVAEGIASPCLVGVFRPTVYLTPEATRDERTLRHVLAHETTHRLHGDCLWSLLRLAALCLHWYNPLVWLGMIVSKRDGELACDEATLARLGEDERVAYGETLLSLVRAKPNTRELLSASTAMTAGRKPMRERIETIAKHPRTKGLALLLAVAVLLTATVFAFSKAEKPEEAPEPEASVGAFDTAYQYAFRGAENVSAIRDFLLADAAVRGYNPQLDEDWLRERTGFFILTYTTPEDVPGSAGPVYDMAGGAESGAAWRLEAWRNEEGGMMHVQQILMPESALDWLLTLPHTGRNLTLDEAREIAKKGEAIRWEDFDGYPYRDSYSAEGWMRYPMDGGWYVSLSYASLYDARNFIYLNREDLGGEGVELHTGDVEAFIAENAKTHGTYTSVEAYIDSVRAERTTATYYARAGGEKTANVLDTRITWLHKLGELSGLAPNGTLEAWSYDILVRLDIDADAVELVGGMSEQDGYFDLDGFYQNVIALRYEDGSLDVLYEETTNDSDLFNGYHDSAEEGIYDWYVAAYGLDLPLYVIDLLPRDELGNHPAHRVDGDGWYFYVPIQAWYRSDDEHGAHWFSQYNTGSSISVRESSVEERNADRPQLAEGQAERFVETPEGRVWLVWTQYTPENITDYPYIAQEPKILEAMAESFTVDESVSPIAAYPDMQQPLEDETAFFESIAGEYWFLSGAGGWRTELTIAANGDGTFTGEYSHGSERSAFSGRFDDVTSVDNNTWSMRLRELDGSAYGIEGADEILVYLPGAPVSELPEEFIRWYCAGLSYGRYQIGNTLPTVGLYNVAEQYGWSAASLHDYNWTELSADEVAAWAEALRSVDERWSEEGYYVTYPSLASCFFTSHYSTPRDINLNSFLNQCPLRELMNLADGTATQAEFDALKAAAGDRYYGADAPTWRYRVSDINAALMQYAGITLDDMDTDWRSDERMLYLPEYDAFYNFTSDFGPGIFTPESGEHLGRVVLLESDGDRLMVSGTPDSFQIMSFTER